MPVHADVLSSFSHPVPICLATLLSVGSMLVGNAIAQSLDADRSGSLNSRQDGRPKNDSKTPQPEKDGSQSTPLTACPVDEPQAAQAMQGMVQPVKIESKRRVAHCFISAKEAVSRASKDGLLLVDVRNANAFAQYRIPGALNIPPEFIKTKSFLRSRPFALLDEGRSASEAEKLCVELSDAGFDQITIVRGGLAGWLRAKGPIEGDPLPQRSLNRMRPSEFAVERAYSDWLVINLSTASKSELEGYLPGAVSVPGAQYEKQFVKNLKTVVAKRSRKGAELRLLIVDSSGTTYEKFESLIAGALPNEVYFLEGGFSGYKGYWTEQAKIWAAAERPAKRPPCGA